MNSTECETLAAKLIYESNIDRQKPHWLVIFDKKLELVQRLKKPYEMLMITRLSSSDLQHGVSPAKWKSIGNLIFKLFKDLNICQE